MFVLIPMLLVPFVMLRWLQMSEELQQVREELRLLTRVDELTGVLNRNAFLADANRTLALAHRHQYACTVLLLDIDGLEEINSQHGSRAGDLVLRTVADILGATVRHTDVIGRLGGDELAIFLPHTSATEAQKIGKQLLSLISSQRFHVEGMHFSTSVSIGLAESDLGSADLQLMIGLADRGLRKAAQSGGNTLTLQLPAPPTSSQSTLTPTSAHAPL